jgi:Flp pilus assembly pilin Flp
MLNLLSYPQHALVTLITWARSRMEDETGAVATEYVLLLTFIAVAIIVVVTAFGQDLISLFHAACGQLGGKGC